MRRLPSVDGSVLSSITVNASQAFLVAESACRTRAVAFVLALPTGETSLSGPQTVHAAIIELRIWILHVYGQD